jgi:transcriptional regulator with XRE-family HTH domain
MVNKERMDLFVDWLKSEMRQRDWRRADLARESQVDKSVLSRILNRKKTEVGPDTANKLAKALNANVTFVYRLAGIITAPAVEAVKNRIIEAIVMEGESLTDEDKAEVLEFVRLKKQIASAKKGRTR